MSHLISVPDVTSRRLPVFLAENVHRMGYRTPTPVQRHAVPLLLSGADLICTAQTGSGKTAAFLLPIVSRLAQEDAEQPLTGNGPDDCKQLPLSKRHTVSRHLTRRGF
jgi:superfamily II DNA/RNA helicase